MFKAWLQKRRDRKVIETKSDIFFRMIKEIKDSKEKIDESMWYLSENHRHLLADQTKLFYDNSEFALTSLLSCLGMAKTEMNKEKINLKLKELGHDSKEKDHRENPSKEDHREN